jgi:hypothetical protein
LDIGPQLLEVGAIDYDRFVQTYRQAGQPLTEAQTALLKEGSDAPVVIGRENAYFLLNFFWALRLANQNPLLDKGPMMQYGEENVDRFASTGGWTISRASIIPLTMAMLGLLELMAAQGATVDEMFEAASTPMPSGSRSKRWNWPPTLRPPRE